MAEIDDGWQLERAMSPNAFKRAIGALNISQSGAGWFLGVSESTLRRYLRGDTDIPTATVMLLRLMIALNLRPLVPKRRLRK